MLEQVMAELLATAEERGGVIGALAFGAELPSGVHAFPSAPTWLLHSDAELQRCYADVPVLLRAATFCQVCDARARLVRAFSAWTLSLLLSRAGLRLHTYPLVRCPFSPAGRSILRDVQ
jgi:hypothetical protein